MSLFTWIFIFLCVGCNARYTDTELRDLADELIDELRESTARIREHQKRVIGGVTAQKSWPYLVSMRFVQYEEIKKEVGWIWKETVTETVKKEEHFCGASLLNDHWLLTAAHCFIANTTNNRLPFVWTNDFIPMDIMEARLGDKELEEGTIDTIKDWAADLFNKYLGSMALDSWQNYEVPFEKVIIHPKYDSNHGNFWDNDIALVKLAKPVPSEPGTVSKIQYVELPDQTNDLSWPEDGSDCIMKGWGCTKLGGKASYDLQRGDLPKLNDAECSNMYEGMLPITHRICAGPLPKEEDLEMLKPFESKGDSGCPGDSGGPLMCPGPNGGLVQAGVTSFINAVEGYTNYFPTIFTRVSRYASWIKRTMVKYD